MAICAPFPDWDPKIESYKAPQGPACGMDLAGSADPWQEGSAGGQEILAGDISSANTGEQGCCSIDGYRPDTGGYSGRQESSDAGGAGGANTSDGI